ncbi:MAG: hypothetical protein ABI389_01975 [Rhodanobacter sp.]
MSTLTTAAQAHQTDANAYCFSHIVSPPDQVDDAKHHDAAVAREKQRSPRGDYVAHGGAWYTPGSLRR